MVKSGITRRIDELGRIVIPKEIRRNLRIHNSDEIDISLDGNSIILNKHEINDNDKLIDNYIYTIGKYLDKNILFTSKDKIISYYLVDKKRIEEKSLNSDIMYIIENRMTIKSRDVNNKLFNNNYYIISPIIINGDIYGSIIIYSEKEILIKDETIIEFSKIFLENYLE